MNIALTSWWRSLKAKWARHKRTCLNPLPLGGHPGYGEAAMVKVDKDLVIEPTMGGDILIVDDKLPNLRALSIMLSQHGYHVRGAPNGPTAMMIVQTRPPDLILLDINMPGMNGYEVCRQLKASPTTADVPIIFISALDALDDKVTAFAAGGVDYITKPFQIEEVLARVETHLSLHFLKKRLVTQNSQLQKEIAEREEAENALQQMNETLEEQVNQRSLELIQKNNELLAEIRQRQQKEKELLESEERFRNTFEQAAVGISHTAPNGRILRINQRFCDILGYSPDEMINLHYQEFTYPEDLAKDVTLAQQVLAGEINTYSLEKRYFRKNGDLIWVNLTVSTVRGEDGRAKYFIAVIEDISERKQMEDAMRRAQKLESLGVLAGGIAHDFNNLLTAIMAETSLALLKARPDSPARPNIQQIMRVAERSAQLTHQLLAYSGKGHFEKKPLNLNTLIEDNFSLLEATLPKSVVLHAELAPELPAIEADAGQIQQVVMNLIINAAEAYEGQGGSVNVQTTVCTLSEKTMIASTTLAPGGYILFTVADTGKGMEEEIITRIFDPFFTTKSAGRGLGLAAVQGIIHDHQGEIAVFSAPGQGTTFQVYFPVVEQKHVVEQELSLRAFSGTGHILVIEDESIIRAALIDILQMAGFSTVEAENGRVALEKFQNHLHEVDMVILDMTMPVLSGDKTLKALREKKADLPILILSGLGEVEIASEFWQMAQVSFLPKPFHVEQLIQMIHQILPADAPRASK